MQHCPYYAEKKKMQYLLLLCFDMWKKSSLTEAIISRLDSINEVNNYASIFL